MPSAGAHLLATLIVFVHLGFVVFVVTGGLLAWVWRPIVYIHVPAMMWGIYVEWSGAICPLTPLENALWSAAGLDPYNGDFVARYVFPVLYPAGLTRGAQFALGIIVVVVNGIVYAAMLRTRKSPSR